MENVCQSMPSVAMFTMRWGPSTVAAVVVIVSTDVDAPPGGTRTEPGEKVTSRSGGAAALSVTSPVYLQRLCTTFVTDTLTVGEGLPGGGKGRVKVPPDVVCAKRAKSGPGRHGLGNGMIVQQIDCMTHVFMMRSADAPVTMKLRSSISVVSGSM